MKIFSTTVLLVLALVAPHVNPFPHGAPTSICQSLTPKHHGIPPQPPQTAPYRIEVSSTTIGQGQTLGIRIVGQPAELPFEGYILQARSFNEPTQIVGSFNEADKSKLMNCGDGNANSITHVDKHKKVNYYVEWNAPTDFVGEVFFNSTILAQFDKFWTGILSEKVNVVQGQVSIQTSPRPATAFTTTQTSFTQTPQTLGNIQDEVYTGCGQSKVCFGLPDNCIDKMSCTIFSSVKVRGNDFEIEMKTTDPNAVYVALGLSDDARMGDDLVTECVKDLGKVSVFTSYTSGPPSYGTSRVGIPQNDARLIDGQIINGQIYCKVQRSPQTTANGRVFNLATEKYHLLVAAGKSLKENGAGYHDIGRNPSSEAINLAIVQTLTSSSNLLIRLHGAFMIAAWIGTTSLGILVARYFKQTWVGSTACGKDMWFAVHRMCMVTTWSLTVAAFILIFVELKAWSGERNPHAILGTITTAICFLQPIGAMFRPAPNAPSRPVFNWLHWLGGNVAHILSIVTIFYAVKLTKAQLPIWMDWILVAFVVYHVAMHLLFSGAACLSDKKTANRVSTFEMSDRTNGRKNNSSGNKMNAAYASFRKGLLGAYIFILLIFVVIFIVIVVLAPIEDTFKSIKSKVMD